jgi:hypothetical protein
MIDNILQTIEALWLFLVKITETAPLGTGSAIIAVVVPACLVARVRKALPEQWHTASRDFIVETGALLVGIGLAWLPWQTVQGLLVGIVAGLLSPYIAKGVEAAWGIGVRWWAKRIGVDLPVEFPRRRVTDRLQDEALARAERAAFEQRFPPYEPLDGAPDDEDRA